MKLLAPMCLSLVLALTAASLAENAAKPAGEPALEAPTLTCLGAYWIIAGDDNANARVELTYRAEGTQAWRQGPPLFRVEKGGNRLGKDENKVKVPSDAWLFAGSVFMLSPDTEYELKLKLIDPDGGQADKTLRARTLAEPAVAKDAPQRHVVPGNGGGSGTAADPFQGLAAAQAQARPGDLFLLHAGVYEGTFSIDKNGQPGKPIVWRGWGDGEAIIDAQGQAGELPARAISASDTHDVWFERLTVRNAQWGLVAHMGQRIVVRRCHFTGVKRGITATRNTDGRLGGFFISDNLLEGPFRWSDAEHGATVEENRGIEISGTGQVVCYNRVRGFKDGIDTFPGPRCEAIDIHNNEVSECLDDGCEMDGSERNCRCFLNRFTNVFQGISVQPVYGGPIYVFRNALYNVQVEPFKMHNSPSGALFIHNTCVKKSMPLILATQDKVRNCLTRNNLFLGGPAGYAFECSPPMLGCDFDYDGFGGGPWGMFLKWNNVRYKTIDEARAQAPVYRHALLVDPAGAFASGTGLPADDKRQYDVKANDLRLKAGSAAIDAGQHLPGLNDGFSGKAPDLGAYELGSELPQYGPRP